jgi:hypothetical protein
MADRSVFRTAVRTPSAQMDADFSTLHAPEAAGEVVDEGCRRVRERARSTSFGVLHREHRMASHGYLGHPCDLCRQGGQAHGKSSDRRYWHGPDFRRGAAMRPLSGRTRHWAARANTAALDPLRKWRPLARELPAVLYPRG